MRHGFAAPGGGRVVKSVPVGDLPAQGGDEGGAAPHAGRADRLQGGNGLRVVLLVDVQRGDLDVGPVPRVLVARAAQQQAQDGLLLDLLAGLLVGGEGGLEQGLAAGEISGLGRGEAQGGQEEAVKDAGGEFVVVGLALRGQRRGVGLVEGGPLVGQGGLSKRRLRLGEQGKDAVGGGLGGFGLEVGEQAVAVLLAGEEPGGEQRVGRSRGGRLGLGGNGNRRQADQQAQKKAVVRGEK